MHPDQIWQLMAPAELAHFVGLFGEAAVPSILRRENRIADAMNWARIDETARTLKELRTRRAAGRLAPAA